MIDGIYNRSPINKIAALSVSRVEQTPDTYATDGRYKSRDRPPIKSYTGPKSGDISGNRYGNLIVIGLWPIKNKGKRRASWVVKCDCGYFEIRYAFKLKRKGANNLCCESCLNTKRFLNQTT